tara:strand:+ start:717 stop:1652 length:936 start_codon:yes stop_codon:yes gene_type:complete
MKNFLPKLIYFLIPLLLTVIGQEYFLRNIPNDYKAKDAYLRRGPVSIETLILGSSHCLYGLNPEFFNDPTFNLAHISQTINIDLELLKKYIKVLPKLKTIIIRVSLPTLFERLEKSGEAWRIKNYNIYYELDIPSPYFNSTEVLSNKFDLNLGRLYKSYFKKGTSTYCTDLGWGTSYHSGTRSNLEHSGAVSAKRHFIPNHQYFDLCRRDFTEMISICEQNKIEIILFTPPGYSTYTNLLDKNQLEITLATAVELARSSDYCTYYNLLSDSSFLRKDFYDADHLNEIGAEKLSIFFNEIIKNRKIKNVESK